MTTENALEVTLHDSQALIQIINANITYCAWPRGGGKTGGGIGPRLQHLSNIMPRTQVLLFSDTYERLMGRIVPNIISFWESKLGWVEGIDFIKYKKPPDHWDKPLIPLDKFDKVISTASGMAVCLVSLAVEGSANAFNAVTAIGDEVKFCDEERIDGEVLPALRGNENLFGHLPEYLSVWMFTDKLGPKIKWFLRKRRLVDQRAVEAVYAMQMEVFRLENELENFTSSATIAKYKKQTGAYIEKMNRIRKHLIYFSDMKPYENLQTLGEFFFKRARRIAKSEYVFNVAFLNYDPDKVPNTYYPTFTKENKYRIEKQKADYDTNQPFIVSMDYNYRIAPMPVVQLSKLPGKVFTTINCIDYVFELHPKGMVDTIETFCKRYQHHVNKEIIYIFDHTAIPRNTLKKTFKEVFVETFDQMGWTVVEKYIGDAPDHDIKFEAIKKIYSRRGENAVMFNEVSADQLIKSIEQSPAKMVSGKTQKDKATERDENFPAEDAPHGSDAFDMILWGIFECGLLYNMGDEAIPIRMV